MGRLRVVCPGPLALFGLQFVWQIDPEPEMLAPATMDARCDSMGASWLACTLKRGSIVACIVSSEIADRATRHVHAHRLRVVRVRVLKGQHSEARTATLRHFSPSENRLEVC